MRRKLSAHILILITLIVSKIAVGDDNAEVLDYRQTIALCLGVERVRGWLLGWERRGIQLPL